MDWVYLGLKIYYWMIFFAMNNSISQKSNLIGELVILRLMTFKDSSNIYKWRTSDRVANNFPSGSEITWNNHQKWMKSVINNPEAFYWMICDISGDPKGLIWLESVNKIHKNAEFGFYIGKDPFENVGFSAESEFLLLTFAFKVLNLRKVFCESISNNKKVIGQHKRFNFKKDGCLRDHFFKDGKFHDIVVMSVINLDFFTILPSLKRIFLSLGSR